MRSPGGIGWWEWLEELGQGKDRRSQPVSASVAPISKQTPVLDPGREAPSTRVGLRFSSKYGNQGSGQCPSLD